MINKCPSVNQIERFLEKKFESVEELKLWESHLETCQQCQDSLNGHQELINNLGEIPVPTLSPFFDQKLQAALDYQKAAKTSTRWKRILLQGYWLLALAASFLILDSLEGPVQIPPEFLVTLAVSGTLAFMIFGLAIRKVKLSFSDLFNFAAVDPEF